MAASDRTVDAILEVLLKHLEQDKIRDIVRDLQRVEGNRSFRETMRKLSQRCT